jgi:hypothetical protein
LTLGGTTDSEFGADSETRISTFGYNIYFCGALIAWKSKAEGIVTLSSTKAEHMGLSETTQEIIFVKQVSEIMGIKLSYPINIMIDNVGAIYLSNNFSLSQCTEHIDIRHHFVRGFVEDGIIKIVFVQTDDNNADIHTKNTPESKFKKDQDKNMCEARMIH